MNPLPLLRRPLPALGLTALLALLMGCDGKRVDGLFKAQVPPLSVPVQSLGPAASAPAASGAAPVSAGAAGAVGGAPKATPSGHAGSLAAELLQAGDAGGDEVAREDRLGSTGADDFGTREPRKGQDGSTRRRGGSGRAPRSAGEDRAAELGVARLTLTPRVARREPTGELSSLRAGQLKEFSTFVELTNETGAASSITVTLTPDSGGASHSVTLPVGPDRRYRTWATLRAPSKPGAYHVVVRDDHGRALARSSLRVSP